ncbi:MAG TPA: YitT family protein [Chloroflexi bacterium]|nr:YitT family protein [Chloroflexota bacterium]
MRKFKGFPFDWQSFLLLTIGGLIQAFNVAIFLSPAKLAPGGVSGTAIILQEFTGWPIGLMMLIMNIPLMVIGFINLGRFKFLTRTLYVVILSSAFVDIFAAWLPPEGITDDLLLNSLYSAVVGGIGSGIIYRGQGTSGGTSILGRIVQLKTGIPISQVYLFTDGIIVVVAGLVFGWERALYSLITLFLWGVASDQVLEGPSVVRTAFIISDQPEAISKAVFLRLGLGITGWQGRGMFTEQGRTVLFCTINRPDMPILRQVVLEIDPHAFLVIGHGHQAIGGVLPRNFKAPGEGKNEP